jgi:hypothetical protein
LWERADARNHGMTDDRRGTTREGQVLRIVGDTDPVGGERFEFLPKMLELPPGVIVELYRRRWAAEKVCAESKNKLGEKKAWTTSLEAKETQVLLIALKHHLLVRYAAELARPHGVTNAAEERRRSKRLETLGQAGVKQGTPLSTLVLQARRATQRSVKFVRWLRQSLRDHAAEAAALLRRKALSLPLYGTDGWTRLSVEHGFDPSTFNSSEQPGGRCLNLVRDRLGDSRGLHLSAQRRHANGDDQAAGDFPAHLALQLVQAEGVGQRLGFLLGHQQVDFHLVLKLQRREEVALAMDARPAHGRFGLARSDGQTQRAEERGFRRLHVVEKNRVMNNARHVGVAKLNPANNFIFESHGRILVCAGEFTIEKTRAGAAHFARRLRALLVAGAARVLVSAHGIPGLGQSQ